MKRLVAPLALTLLLSAAACAAGGGVPGGTASGSASSGGTTAGAPATLVLDIDGKVKVEAELALTEAERERGLMFREGLARGKGMLFVFPSEQRLSFWMKNTLVPLSVAYVSSDGVIREIHDMKPGSLDPVPSEFSCLYALEVPALWFVEVGVAPGAKIGLEALKEASARAAAAARGPRP